MASRLDKVLNAFDQNNARLAAIAAGGGPLAALAEHLGDIAKLEVAAKGIHARVTARLEPTIRDALAEKFAESRVGTFTEANPKKEKSKYKPTGKLYSAAVTKASIEVSPKGISIGLGKGFSKDVYVRAGALNSGWVQGSATTGSRKRKSEKATLAYAHEKTGQTAFGGAKYHEPHEFFNIDARMDEIEELYAQYFEEEVNKVINGN